MSKEKLIKKGEHMCSVCGRISAAKSVLKEVKGKNGVITYRCSNQKKCAENKKKGLPKNYLNNLASRREKKKVVAKKATATKKTEKVAEAQATA
ncbi:hypothetical protein KA005_56055 [bacterium]|nr:hypothetical protein [bacterium]